MERGKPGLRSGSVVPLVVVEAEVWVGWGEGSAEVGDESGAELVGVEGSGVGGGGSVEVGGTSVGEGGARGRMAVGGGVEVEVEADVAVGSVVAIVGAGVG